MVGGELSRLGPRLTAFSDFRPLFIVEKNWLYKFVCQHVLSAMRMYNAACSGATRLL